MRSAGLVLCALVWLGGVSCAGQESEDCHRFGEQVHEQARKLAAPPDWKIQIVCGQEQWRQLLSRTRLEGKADRALTAIETHTTFLYAHGFRGDLMWVDIYQTLAHEIAHILCACPSEKTAQLLATELMAHKGWMTATGRHIAPTMLNLLQGSGQSILYRHKVSGELFVLTPEHVLVPGQPADK